MTREINILVGGEAGQGIQTVGFILGKSLVKGGWHVFADQDYESRIRGGHNFFRVRAGEKDARCQKDGIDILVALNKQTLDLHQSALNKEGVVLLDCRALGLANEDARFVDVPLQELADSAGGRITLNSVAVGAVVGLIGFDFAVLARVLQWHFAKHEAKVQEDNVKAARAGYDYAVSHYPQRLRDKYPVLADGRCLFLTGNEAISLGAIAAGCRFAAAYPMTPTTSILEYLAERGEGYGIAVVQPEDEIAAINMVIGASYAGARALTATSGSGFALMTEGLGLAAMTETPAVVVLGQRPGPAIGLPTRTEQGELWFAIKGGTGESPRAVLTPGTPEEAFWLTIKAFNLADKYQIPVILLIDTHLANSYCDVAKFDLSRVVIERGELVGPAQAGKLADYRRYALSESGISPRALPLQTPGTVVADSDEHSESGHLIEDAATRIQQVEKRLKKSEGLAGEAVPPRVSGPPSAKVLLIGWGSTLGALEEAAAQLSAQGTSAGLLHLSQVWPLPGKAIAAAMSAAERCVVVENNATGQLAALIRAETGIGAAGQIHKYDGRPISAAYILEKLAEVTK